MRRFREALILGLLVLAPLGVTLWILWRVIKFVDDAVASVLPFEWPTLFGVEIPGLGILATLALLSLTGLFAKTVAGQLLSRAGDSLMGHLPVVRGLYGIAKQMSQIFFAGDKSFKAFKRVVEVPFPSQGLTSLAFVTGHYSDTQTVVFVPTAPNPTSGYVVIFDNSQIRDSKISVDEALKMILSCGTLLQPKRDAAARETPA